jgi:hypothetical protein
MDIPSSSSDAPSGTVTCENEILSVCEINQTTASRKLRKRIRIAPDEDTYVQPIAPESLRVSVESIFNYDVLRSFSPDLSWTRPANRIRPFYDMRFPQEKDPLSSLHVVKFFQPLIPCKIPTEAAVTPAVSQVQKRRQTEASTSSVKGKEPRVPLASLGCQKSAVGVSTSGAAVAPLCPGNDGVRRASRGRKPTLKAKEEAERTNIPTFKPSKPAKGRGRHSEPNTPVTAVKCPKGSHSKSANVSPAVAESAQNQRRQALLKLRYLSLQRLSLQAWATTPSRSAPLLSPLPPSCLSSLHSSDSLCSSVSTSTTSPSSSAFVSSHDTSSKLALKNIIPTCPCCISPHVLFCTQ